MSNRLRLVGGLWRSRVIEFPDAPGLRPTPNRVRETLFNWLRADVVDARCLDLFCGSGALGFEALSRGARQVMQVESRREVCEALRRNAARLGAAGLEVVEADVFCFLEGPAQPFDLAFLDPPFGRKLAEPCCRLLEMRDWLREAALVYVEAEAALPLREMPENWRLVKSGKAGEVGYYLYRRETRAATDTPSENIPCP